MESTPMPPSDPNTRSKQGKSKAPTKAPKRKTKCTKTKCTVNTLDELKATIASAPVIPAVGSLPVEPALISVCNGTFYFGETIGVGGKAFDMCCPKTEECIFQPDADQGIRLFAAANEAVDFSMEGFTFQNGFASRGGAIRLYYAIGDVKFTDNTFQYNSAILSGGALYLGGSQLTVLLEGNTFDGNRAGFSGGAVYTYLSTVDVRNNIFINNEAEFYGGALYLRGTSSLDGNTFDSNRAVLYGGALFLGGTSSLDRNTFRSNKAYGPNPSFQSDNIYSRPGSYTCNATNNFCNGVSSPANLQTTMECGAASPVC